jgi:hypothetical protein
MRSPLGNLLRGLSLSAGLLSLISSVGHAAWPTDPASNVAVSASPARIENGGFVAPDSCGGALVVWEDTDTLSSVNRLVIQRVDAFGQVRWAPAGVPLRSPHTGLANQYGIASDMAGGAFVVFALQGTAATGRDVFVQHVLAAGEVDPAWPADGLQV